MRHTTRVIMLVLGLLLAACAGGDQTSDEPPDADGGIATLDDGEDIPTDEAEDIPGDGEGTTDDGGDEVTGELTTGSVNLEIAGGTTATVDEPLTSGSYAPGFGEIGATIALFYGSADTTLVVISGGRGNGEAQLSFAVNTGGLGYVDRGERCTLVFEDPQDGVIHGTIECTGLDSDDGSNTIDVTGTFTAS